MAPLKVPKILRVRVRDLRPWGENPREHGQEQLEQLQKSLDQFGLASLPVVQAGTLRILAGHGRVQALMDAGHGDEVIPVVALELGDDDAAAYTVADNRLAEVSEWNPLQLRDVLGELDNGAQDMLALGWTQAAMMKLFGRPIDVQSIDEDSEPVQVDPVPVVAELWIYPDRVEALGVRPGILSALIESAVSAALGISVPIADLSLAIKLKAAMRAERKGRV